MRISVFRVLRTLLVFFVAAGLLVLAPVTSAQAVPSQSVTADAQLQASQALDRGVDAFKAGHYDQVIEHFRNAFKLNPQSRFAKLYLATALTQTIVPGSASPGNLKTADEAIALFLELHEAAPRDINTVKQIAGVYYQIGRFAEAIVWQKRVLNENPKDPEAAYTIGAINWQLAHQNVLTTLVTKGVNDDGLGNLAAPEAAHIEIARLNARLVEEALLYLHQAVENRPSYDDAMAYLNLVYRRKADLDWKDPALLKQDLALADEWRAKAMAARRANQSQAAAPETTH